MVKRCHLLLPLAVATTSLAAANPLLGTRAPCGEGPDKICYGVSGGEPQQLDPDDIQYVADYLRYIGDQNTGAGKFWSMPKAVDCAEWSLPVPDAGTVLALAKHIKARVSSSILYKDLAATIDGGVGASDAQKKAALAGCGANGGQLGAKANTTNPLYDTDEYKKSGAKPEGIIIKLVRAPNTS
ncbi:hypothetical protein JDV02_010633 [Purpureocillium takamizusanense]|uniref:Uncharacterized protein n=1 Tax=Purpureocillium takamizusanense TaxID=2060973 RepID=A0A9Q8QU60_9HYPO|nr:uncharacterized protein JDV02_010633 [Purpureocillium takamizusanense]UNI24916.1 hypothetical protein JDV02_010633 [Purpureocillium takamizusanense]